MEIYILILVVLLFLSGFFSSAETAFLSLERVQVAERLSAGVPGAGRIATLLESPRRLLSAILLGNNLANTGAAAVGTAIATEIVAGGPGVLAATLVVTVLLVIFGEVAPKTTALHHNFAVARVYAWPLQGWARLMTPAVNVLDGLSRAVLSVVGERGESRSALSLGELRSAIRLGAETGTIERDESAMLLGALALPTRQVRRVMTPRVNIVAVEADAPLGEVATTLAESGFLRLLVQDGSLDEIVGFVHVSDVSAAQASDGEPPGRARDLMREASFESERAPVARVLESMQQSGAHLAVLVDEFGATSGIVTLEDILEEVVGEIRSESGPQRSDVAVRVGGRLYVEAQRPLGDLGQELDADLAHGEAESVGGLILAHLRHIPARGEWISHAGYRFTVLAADSRRVRLVAVEPEAGPDDESAAAEDAGAAAAERNG
jgi:CBS domain containing-hemolysin-like protein